MSRAILVAILAAVVASGCATSRKIVSRVELQNLSTVQPMTVYAEGHRKYELQHHALVDSVIRGTGTVSSAGKSVSFEGAIPLMSIHAIETPSTNALKGLAMMGMSVLFVAAVAEGNGADRGMSAVEGTTYHAPPSGGGGWGGDGSCPYVYVWNGERYVLDAEPFGIGLGRAMELTTVHLLPSARAQDGVVRLRLTNERPETHYVNSLQLYAVELGTAPAAVLDGEGNAWPLWRPIAPVRATERLTRDILREVASADGRMWECEPSAFAPGSAYEDVIEIAFVRPQDASTGLLVLQGINTNLSTFMFAHLCRIAGNQAPELVHGIDTDPELIGTLKRYLEDASLKASIWNGSGWEAAGVIRPEANGVTFTRALRIRAPESSGDTVRLRLRGMADVWKVDALSMDWSPATILPMRPLQLLSAIGPEGEDMREILRSGDRRYAILVPPDRVELTYEAAPGDRVAYAVAGRGYLHEWIPRPAPSDAVTPVSWVPEERRIEFLKDVLKNRDLTLEPVYDAWRKERAKRSLRTLEP